MPILRFCQAKVREISHLISHRVNLYMKDLIFNLKKENPHWGYQRIADVVGCSKNTVKYWLLPEERDNNRLRMQRRHPLEKKISRFCSCDGNKKLQSKRKVTQLEKTIPLTIVLDRFGSNPTCYLTGELIDLYKPSSYSLDHIIPLNQGGSSKIENMGLCSTKANLAKSGLTPEQFKILCQSVLTNLH